MVGETLIDFPEPNRYTNGLSTSLSTSHQFHILSSHLFCSYDEARETYIFQEWEQIEHSFSVYIYPHNFTVW